MPNASRRPQAPTTPVARRAVVALCLLALAGCSERSTPSGPRTELVVFAAASLERVFSSLGDAFRRAHPDVRLRYDFAGTQVLRLQIEQGAPADVFASADRAHMQALLGAGRVRSPVLFATNEPVIVVSREQARRVHALRDLPQAERIVVGTPDVPIGRYTRRILDRAARLYGADFRERVERHVVSRELSVRQVLSKVLLGEAEAGIVYRTDTTGAPQRLSVVPIPASVNLVADYPIAVVAGARHPRLARAFVELLLSPEGQAILARAGFRPPPASAP